MNVITFQGTANFLAMIYPSSFIIEGITYKSVEHFYQAQKIRELVNENHAKTIIAVNDTTSVRRVAQGILKRCRVDPNITKRWKMNRCANVLYRGVWSKFRQYPELASKLLKTEYKLLINSFDGDDIFTSGCSPVQLREWVRAHFGCVIEVPYEFLPADQFPVIAQGYNILGVVTMWVRKELRSLYQRAEKKTNVSMRSDDVTELLSGLSISKTKSIFKV
uniref:NADAR domain-containing protein n=1 Tax=Acrobeloides nanus TaxID=290746 RepID=A0A914DLN9_9BILA